LGHAATPEADIQAALTDAARADGVTASSVAVYTQAVIQGAFIVAKASNDPAHAVESLRHLRRYLATLLRPPLRT
jgi:TetR/AcrR family transcriptional regulator, transcriptional repressor for nem operon